MLKKDEIKGPEAAEQLIEHIKLLLQLRMSLGDEGDMGEMGEEGEEGSENEMENEVTHFHSHVHWHHHYLTA